MNETPGSAADNLTGVWNGVFQQPDCGSVAFTATLIESGGQITGSTHEPCALHGCPRKTHLDPPGFGYGTVSYRGDLNGDATEIAGTWTIAGGFSGEFLMIRAGRSVPARARKKRATV
jgi:hypothetical protein